MSIDEARVAVYSDELTAPGCRGKVMANLKSHKQPGRRADGGKGQGLHHGLTSVISASSTTRCVEWRSASSPGYFFPDTRRVACQTKHATGLCYRQLRHCSSGRRLYSADSGQ
ncbi:hypothetical protein LIA77_00440 [Sarocladium implicatum]|nr:hypothetical protein LIA77_00440 [Sarocladium implicatum]